MLLPGGPPLPPSSGCRSAAILRAEQIRRHCQRDAATPRAAVPERVPILATLILTRRKGAWVDTSGAPLVLVVPPWRRARPAASSGKVAMRILRPTRSRLSLQCCAHDTASSGHAGQLGASQAGGSENARHRSRVIDCVGCRATVLGCGGQPKKNLQIASQQLRSRSSRRTATRHQPLRHCLSQVPACARRAPQSGFVPYPSRSSFASRTNKQIEAPLRAATLPWHMRLLTLPLGSMRPLG